MLIRAIIICLWCCVSVSSAAGQPHIDSSGVVRPPGQGVSVQLGGNAPILSLNYHHTLLHIGPKLGRTGRGSVEVGMGLGYTPQLFEQGYVSIPHYLSVNYGSRLIRGELGYGATNGPRGLLFARPGYQPGVIAGIRIVPTARTTIRLFSWTTFYRDTYHIQDAQFRIIQRETQYVRVFGGVSFVRYLN